MIHIGRRNEFPNLSCYVRRRQKGLKRFQYRYKDEVISDAEYEARIAFDHFTNEENYEERDGRRQLTANGKRFEFWIYRRAAIRAELNRVFRGKCAYCEYEIHIRDDFDVEHFRPKKAVEDSETGELKEPGYYWLAADWPNLMPSCPYCNQERKHEMPGSEGVMVLGKKNQFPLSDEQMRLSRPDQRVEDEEAFRLLVNPCVDQPEDFLSFVTHNDKNELGHIKPVERDGRPDIRGENSILVYALNSKAIVDRRHKHADDVIKVLQRLVDLATDYGSNPTADFLWKYLEDTVSDLHELLSPNAKFLGLTRQLIRDYDRRQAFVTVKQHGIDPMEMVAASVRATSQDPV